MNNISVFNFESNEVRTTINDGEVWFVALDVCKVLGFSNPSKAMQDHCKGLTKSETLKIGGWPASIIKESDVYRLVMRSKLPSAERFQDWVCEDVLPSIRKTGGYEIPKTYAGVLQLAANQALLIEQKDEQIKILKPKGEFFDKAAESNHLLTATEVGHNAGNMSAVKLNRILDSLNVYNKSIKSTRVFKQWFMDKGYGKLVQREGGYTQAMFTVKGEQWIFEQLNQPKAA